MKTQIGILDVLLSAVLMLMLCSAAYAGSTEAVSVNKKGEIGNDSSFGFDASADSRYVAFRSKSDNLVPGDKNGVADIFVRDRVEGTTERVSLNSRGKAADDECEKPNISANGRFVVFASRAENLVEGVEGRLWQMYMHDRETGETILISANSAGEPGNQNSASAKAAISDDGRYVVFSSNASNLVPGTWRQLYLRDTVAGTTEVVSVSTGGIVGDGFSLNPIISSEGRYVAFESNSNNLVPNDTSAALTREVYLRDRLAGTIVMVSVSTEGVQANTNSFLSDLSDDGQHVAFFSGADNLVVGDLNGQDDGFVRNVAGGVTLLVTVGSQGQQGNGGSANVTFAFDGSIAFCSSATNFDANFYPGVSEAFVRDHETGVTELWTITTSDWDYRCQTIAKDLSAVIFGSGSGNYIPYDDNGWFDVFARTR